MIKDEKIEGQIFEPDEKLDISTQMGILQAYRPAWLAKWDDFRQVDWSTEIEFPELIFQQIQQLLAISV